MNHPTPTDAATPRLWKQDGEEIRDANGKCMATVDVDNAFPRYKREERAALIVRAVNEYDALCKVANISEELRQEQASLAATEDCQNEAERIRNRNFYRATVHEAEAKLDDALAELTTIRNQKG